MPMRNKPVIGIHMDGESIDFAIVQDSNIIMRTEAIQTSDYASPDAVLEEIGKRLLELKNIIPGVCAVGMGLTGFADYHAGTVHSLIGAPGWHDIPIRRILTEISGLPAAIDNDAHCCAYAEWKYGAGRGKKDLVCLNFSRGIGAGIIANGQFLRGSIGAAGEIGQSSIDYCGRIGHYGNRGAIENYIGSATISRDARAYYAAAGITKSLEQCSPKALALAAHEGCPTAQLIWDKVANQLASCMVNCCYILNPSTFILSGELARIGDPLIIPLHRYLRAQLFFSHYDALEIIPSQLEEDAGIIGAALIALDSLVLDYNE